MKEETPRETPEESRGDESQNSATKSTNNQTAKDRKCQYCNQSFTSSSLGRHLDQFLFKKKPDGVHDVEEIRRIRSGITRRQARTTSGKRDGSPDHDLSKSSTEPYPAGESSTKSREAPVRMMFNTPTWHATGVINDIPNPSRALRWTSGCADTRSDGIAAAAGLRKSCAASGFRPRPSPFDFDLQAQTFPSLCLHLLPPPPSLFAAHPFSSPTSFPIQAPGAEHLDIVRQALRSKIAQWQSDQLAADSTSHSRCPGGGMDNGMVYRTAQQHEEISFRHLDLAFNHWSTLPLEARREAWSLEIMRAFSREAEKRKSSDEQLARVQQEANQLRAQVERLGACQWPRSHISPDSARWDYDNVVAKWKRVIMHDKGMGRIGVGYGMNAGGFMESDNGRRQSPDAPPPRPGEDTSSHPNRLRPLQAAVAMSPDPANTSTPASSTNYASPFSHADPRSPPGGSGPSHQNKRPRLMNGSDGPNAPSAEPPASRPGTWHSSTPILSNLAAPSNHTPPSSSRG
ncbi:uncharacterized protein N7477_009611 [Penicillium maclennaniae]|uniref:uncharacterized protein n=1 Tax=Penicillium maclennaniae TaxID=1343394 RepID=UPI0025425418|nr:uncharacterized protein N7477_009611 [Penicillium maclennaniae]KAJ5661995.1 hypothetical protein N7477_009611 [Penicillium maclennaniae]